MSRLLASSFAILLLIFARPASAEFVSGNELLTKCESKLSTEQGMCIGYILGVVDLEPFYTQYEGVDDLICLPEGVTSGQLMDVIVKYMKENPKYRHYTASNVVTLALGTAFPCTE